MRLAPIPERAAARLVRLPGAAVGSPTEAEARLCDGSCHDLRCGCGSLLARRVQAGVELKCRRCKRTLVLPLGDG